ncbi:MAG TPA: class I SAM-dependent methyltransferase [Caulobacteraceae bacterium]|nr:class I SAM-dependent methyltransferase [Caulobacteraceae bacterium]
MSADDIKSAIDRIFRAEQLRVDPSLFGAISQYVSQTERYGINKFTFLSEFAKVDKSELLDFGCGRMAHRPYIRSLGFNWNGIDIFEPLDFRGSRRNHPAVTYYDGEFMPFPDAKFDVIFSSQSFEHIHNVNQTFSEISRCIKPGGAFIGATSFMEPYHAYSTFNYSPYGFVLTASRYGLEPFKLHPEADAVALILRKLLVITGAGELDKWMMERSLEAALGEKASRLTVRQFNCLRLQFCGQFCFWFNKT